MCADLLYHPTERKFPWQELPHVTVQAHPEYEDFYQRAWQLAWDHVCESDYLPFSPYLSEGCNVNKMWIWDSCLMTMFCRYAPSVFPCENTLDNLYAIHEDVNASKMVIHHLDNPPLFAWAEWMLYTMTGDTKRLQKSLPHLITHFNWLETIQPGTPPGREASIAIAWKKEPQGYRWSGNPSGMDNTPRGKDDYDAIWWVDALAQQALNAQFIAKIAAELNDQNLQKQFNDTYQAKKQLLETYWDNDWKAFLDKYCKDGSFCRVLTPASYWALMAGCATPEQARDMAEHLKNPNKLGGRIPFPSVSRDDPEFQPLGAYWRGGIWLPVAYMSVKSLEVYGMNDLADKLTKDLLREMLAVYNEYDPHTIWECYSPDERKPSTAKKAQICRRDFCGWSALGPISLLIENLIGIRKCSAKDQTITWKPGLEDGALGIENFKLGTNPITLWTDRKTLKVKTQETLTLTFDGTTYTCQPGDNSFQL